MKNKVFTSYKSIIFTALLVSNCAWAGWFSEDVDWNKLPLVVLKNPEFAASPALKVRELTYVDKVVTISAVNAAVFEEKLNYVNTFTLNPKSTGEGESSAALKSSKRSSGKSVDDHSPTQNLIQYGTSMSTLGGLFTLGLVKNDVNNSAHPIQAESKAIKELVATDGSLFPLKLGNSFFFSYFSLNDSDKHGVTFDVKKIVPAAIFAREHPEIKGFNLLGDIYVIERELKSSNNNFYDEPCELYFADELSYVVGSTCVDAAQKTSSQWITSYKLNKFGVSYREEVAALNKAKEQSELERKTHVSEQLTPELKAKARDRFSQAFQLYKEGEFEAAVIRFNQALEIDPANGLGHYYLAETYAHLNKPESAKEHYGYTVTFSPDLKESAIAQVKLGKIQESLNNGDESR